MTPNFKGEVRTTKRGNKYYATHTATTFLASVGLIGAAMNVIAAKKDTSKLIKSGIAIGVGLLAGLYTDKKRNEHAAEKADLIQRIGAKRAYMSDDRIELSENRHLYYKSNDGKKYLTRLYTVWGAILGAAMAVSNKRMEGMPEMSKTMKRVVAPIISTATGALTGLINGAITDWINNRTAKKHA